MLRWRGGARGGRPRGAGPCAGGTGRGGGGGGCADAGAQSSPAGRGWTAGAPPPARGGPAAPLARWVDDVVIGRGLCPFAEPARGRTRFVEIPPPPAALGGVAADVESAAAFVRDKLVEELRLLAGEPPGHPATTLVALPWAPAFTFEQFMLLVVLPLQELAEGGTNGLGESLQLGSAGGGCGIQCVPFHPEAEYGEGTEAEEWATRAPHAAVHLLRDCDVEAAELQWQMAGLDPADIHRDNVRRLRELGASRAAAMVRDCAEPEHLLADVAIAPDAADAGRTEAAARALLAETAEVGASTEKLGLRRIGPLGWGAVAGRDLMWDEVMLSLPRAALRTPADARAAGLRGTGHPAGDLAALLLREKSLGAASPLEAYISMLPSPDLLRAQHPLLALEVELAAALGRETLVGSEAIARRREALQIAGDVRSACASGSPEREDVLWALAVVSSRAFHLDLPEEGPSLALCPVADMLNHSEAASAQERARLRWDPASGAAVVRAYRDFAAGEQVFDSFGGALSVRDAFLRYGFASGVGAERVTVPLDRLVTSIRTGAGRAVLVDAGLESAELAFTAEGPDEVGLACLAAAEATEEELSGAGWGEEGGEGRAVLARICAGLEEEPWARSLAARTWARLEGALRLLLEPHSRLDGGGGGVEGAQPWEAEARVALESEERVLRGAVRAAAARAGESVG